MTDELAKALEMLAQKLGTTSEYLWGVLLKQAPLTAITDLIQYTIIIVSCIIWYKMTKIINAKVLNYDLGDEHLIWIVIVWVILAISIIVVFFSLPNTIYAIFNPEYWTLDKLLSEL